MRTTIMASAAIIASVSFAMDPPGVMWERVYFPEEEYTSFKYIEEIDNGNLVATMSASISPSNAFCQGTPRPAQLGDIHFRAPHSESPCLHEAFILI